MKKINHILPLLFWFAFASTARADNWNTVHYIPAGTLMKLELEYGNIFKGQVQHVKMKNLTIKYINLKVNDIEIKYNSLQINRVWLLPTPGLNPDVNDSICFESIVNPENNRKLLLQQLNFDFATDGIKVFHYPKVKLTTTLSGSITTNGTYGTSFFIKENSSEIRVAKNLTYEELIEVSKNEF